MRCPSRYCLVEAEKRLLLGPLDAPGRGRYIARPQRLHHGAQREPGGLQPAAVDVDIDLRPGAAKNVDGGHAGDALEHGVQVVVGALPDVGQGGLRRGGPGRQRDDRLVRRAEREHARLADGGWQLLPDPTDRVLYIHRHQVHIAPVGELGGDDGEAVL